MTAVPRLRPAGGAARIATDAELFRSVAEGDLGALGGLFDAHHARVRAFLARAAAQADVDDLVQETFLAAARAAASYDGRDDAGPFLVGVAARLVSRRKRSFARLRSMLSRFAGDTERHGPDTPEQIACSEGDAAVVRAAMATLPEDRRVALLLVEWEGMTGDEAARMLGVPVGTLYRRLHEARAYLRRALQDHEVTHA